MADAECSHPHAQTIIMQDKTINIRCCRCLAQWDLDECPDDLLATFILYCGGYEMFWRGLLDGVNWTIMR